MFGKLKSIRFLPYGIALSVLCLVMLTAQIRAAVLEDNRSAGGAFSNTGVTTLSFSHTIGSGTSRALYVGVSTTSAAAPPAVCPVNIVCQSLSPVAVRTTGVTYNNLAMEFVGRANSSDVNNVVELYRLVEPLPAAGTYNVVVSFVPGTSTHAVGSAVSFTGVNQQIPNSAFYSNQAPSPNGNPFVFVDTTTTGSLVMDVLAASPTGGFFSASIPQTVCRDAADETTCTRGRSFFSLAYDVGASSTKAAESSLTKMNWQTTFDYWVLGAVAINPLVSTAASVSVSGRVLLPSGRAVTRARVILTGSTGETRTAFTNPFGYYRFENVSAGETYVLDVREKHNLFVPQVIVVSEETNELNFTASPQDKRLRINN
jgi:Carboxypeptidase regulatory-like domain